MEEHILGYIDTINGFIKGFYDVDQKLAESAKNKYLEGLIARQRKIPSEKLNQIIERVKSETLIYSDYKALIDNVDLIDVCTPPLYHTYYTKLAAEKGKGVLCEKPFARSYWDAKDSIAGVKSAKIPFYMFTQVIYNDIFKFGKKLIDEGLIGDIIRIKNCHATKDLDHTVSNKNFWDPLVSGGGALSDIGPHAYSVQKYWLGENYRLKSVQDKGIDTRVKNRKIQGKQRDVIVDDIALLELEWDNNGKVVKGEIEAYWGAAPYKFGLYHEIEGTKGIMKFPNGTLGLLLGKSPLFGIHVFFTVESKETGKITKYSMVQPKVHSESIILIDEFCGGKPSRNPIEFAEDMTLMIQGGYISKNLNRKRVSVNEIKEFCQANAKGANVKEQADSIIKKLFQLQ